MDDKKADRALLGFLFMPVILAIGGLILEFSYVDLIYLILIGCLLLRLIICKRNS